MVAISPFSSMAAPSSNRVELKASSSTSGRAAAMQISPPRSTAVHSYRSGPSREKYSAPTTVKAKSTAESFQILRRPPPLLLSNFFAPLLSQNHDFQKEKLSFSVVQGKRPMTDDFPSLTAQKPAEISTALAAQENLQPDAPPTLKEPKKHHLNKSFREAVSSSWAKDVDVSFHSTSVKVPSTFEGEPAIVISEEEEAKLAQKFRFALIAKFNRGRPTMAVIRQDVLNAGFTGEVYVGLIDHKHVILQFKLESDSHRIWMKKVWSFRGFQANIFRWSIDFCPEKESSIVPVWTSFPLLPLHLCDKETLFAIGSTVGDPLKLDLATAAMEKVLRPSEARLCIAVDVLQPLPQRVRIGPKDKGKWQQIVYEDLPEFCTKCSKLGHSDMNCKRKGPAQVWVQKNKTVDKDKDAQTNGNEAMAVGLKDQSICVGTQACTSPEQAEKIVDNGTPIVAAEMDHFIKNLGQFLEFFNRQEEGSKEVELPSFSNDEGPAVAELELYSTSQPRRIKDKKDDQILYRSPVDEQQRPQVRAPVVDWDAAFLKVSKFIAPKLTGDMDPPNVVTQMCISAIEVGMSSSNDKPKGDVNLIGVESLGNMAIDNVSDVHFIGVESVGNMSIDNVNDVNLIGVETDGNMELDMMASDKSSELPLAVSESSQDCQNASALDNVNLIGVDLVPPTLVNCVLEEVLDCETAATEVSNFAVPKLIDEDKPKCNAVAESVGKVMTWNKISGFQMVASEQTMEFDNDSEVSGSIGDRPKGLNFLNDAWSNLVGLSHITPEFQTNENCWEEMSDSSQTAGVSPSESVAFFANIFSRANLEEDKKRKYGMSDRVLRSMLRASNSDPVRPGSL